MNNFISKHKWAVALIIIGVLIILGTGAYFRYRDSIVATKPYTAFTEDVKAKEIAKIEYSPKNESMKVTLLNGEVYKTLYPEYEDFRKEMLAAGIDMKKTSVISSEVILAFMEAVLLLGMIAYLTSMTGKIGNVRDRDLIQKSDVRFDQVIGLDEIVDDISLYVSMIKNPSIGKDIGAQTPKGLLLTGEPGTGKTLLAKAIAGEADVPFISVSGSEFIELYKGVGAKRVRKIFKIARRNAPCVIFIDEIDAIGIKRDSDESDSEDAQTINQLLKEMDGFKDREGVFVLAATNCPDKLDSALKRSGRFDRQIAINPPRDWRVRKELLSYYLKNYQCDSDIDIDKIAKSISGFTGADVAMICNEASLVAIMKKLSAINMECIEEAIDKKVFNGNRSRAEQMQADKKIVAYHESGHAVMKFLLGENISRVSIIGNTSGVGGAVFGEEKEGFFKTARDIRNDVAVCYAGRLVEKIKFGDVTTGAQNDISQATDMLVSYVTKYGFDDEIGIIDVSKLNSIESVDKDITFRVRKLSKQIECEAEKKLMQNQVLIERLAEKLLEEETLSGNAVYELLNG